MTDWDRVEELRAKGWDWNSIAKEDDVGFAPPEGAKDPGKALRTAYVNRRARATQRARRRERRSSVRTEERRPTGRTVPDLLIQLGIAVALLGAVWYGVATVFPIAGALVPPFPDVLGVLLVGVGLLTAGMVLGVERSFPAWKKYAVVGLAIGLLAPTAAGLAAQRAGVPNLSTNIVPATGSNWYKAANDVWTSGGRPVIFFYGSVACPYCAATSWALYAALNDFGALSGTTFTSSSPSDVYPNTPEVSFVSATYASAFMTLVLRETDNNQQITLPSLNLVEQAYVSTYNSGQSIPFELVGGVYFHLGSLIAPTAFAPSGTPLTPQAVAQSLGSMNPSDPVYQAIRQAQVYLEAYFVKIDQIAGIVPPASVTNDAAVMAVVAQIT